jgi:protoporphyrinogen/coproporphyrinogen III oxidase
VRIVVVGGGITGLSAAYELVHAGDDRVEVTVLERDDRFGGKIRTQPFAGHPLDEAADAFLARVPDAVDLCHDLGLDDDLVSPAVRQAYLYSRGELRPFPEGVVLGVPTDLDALTSSGAVSPDGVARAALDLSMGPDPARFGVDDPPDESVGAVVRRRVGDEVFERLVAPLLSGVHAGSADRLSLAAGAPQLAAALRDHPSLIGGLQAQRAAADPDRPVFFGLVHGSETLTEALVDALRVAGADLRLGATVEAIEPQDGRAEAFTVRVAGTGEWLDADAVVLTCPLDATATLLARLTPDAAAAMSAVAYADVALVALAAPIDGIGRPLDGSGFLVAQPEGLLLTACSWASSKWSHLADPNLALLRASVGRADDTRLNSLDDDELIDAVRADLATTMGLDGAPSEVRVTRWARALPQFEVGHLERVRAWRATLAADHPRIEVAGAGLSGLGIPACIGQGRAAARSLLAAAR